MCVGSKLFMYPALNSDNTIEHIFTLKSTLTHKIRQVIRNLNVIPEHTCSVASSLHKFHSGGPILVGDDEENSKIKKTKYREMQQAALFDAF